MSGPVIALGMLAGLGAFLLIRGALTPPIRLGDAMALLDQRAPEPPQPLTQAKGLEGVGERLQRRLRLPLTTEQVRLLTIQGRSVGDFFAEKLTWALAGLLLPVLWAALQLAFGRPPGIAPLWWSLIGAAAGYFLADLRLKRGAERHRVALIDGIHTFFDLVVLERLANASAAQATANAASVSDAPLFRRISNGLERARMQQTQPWDELRAIGSQWRLPELVDFADIMQLEEQGAGLADVLQARVRELRDAHLNRQKEAAQAASESLTLWMTIPALLLGVALLTPALLTLVEGR